MRMQPLGLSVGLPMGPRNAVLGGGDACGRQHWGLRWSSLWGHETCEGCAEVGVGDACGRQHWGLRWNSLWGHDENDGGDDQQESEKREAEEWHSETELRPSRTIEGRRTGGGDGRGGGKGRHNDLTTMTWTRNNTTRWYVDGYVDGCGWLVGWLCGWLWMVIGWFFDGCG